MRIAHVVAVLFVAVFSGFVSWPGQAFGQVQLSADPRVEARRLRDAGDYIGAISILRIHLAVYPDDGDAVRMLAETLYWVNDVPGSTAVSEQGLRSHPDDTELRLQYAQMLIKTGSGQRAREVLAPVASPATGGRSDAILGTLAYWEGDLATAKKLLNSAVVSGDTDPAIRRMRADISVLTAPWVKVAPLYQRDDQPVSRKGASAEAGWFPVPSTSVSLSGHSLQLSLGDTASRTVSMAELASTRYAPAAHAEINASFGAVTRSFATKPDLIGDAGVAFRASSYVKVGISAARSAYLATEASLSQAVMSDAGTVFVRLDHPRGWLGQTAYQLQRFPDSNTLTSTYVWVLAPLIRSQSLDLRAGYSGAYENSDESRFSIAHPVQSYLPGDARYDLSGSYQPYYTPADQQSHSAIAAFTARFSGGATLDAGGSYAFRATESAPVLAAVTTTAPGTTSVQRSSYTRHFNPWNGHASMTLRPSSDVSIVGAAEAFRTGFYSSASFSVALVYRFANRAIQMAGGY